MSAARWKTFPEFVKGVSVPLLTVGYLLGVTAGIRQNAAIVGWRIVFVVVFSIAVAWTVYTWTARELTVVEPRQLKRRFGSWVRYGAIVAVLAAAVPLGLSFRPRPGVPKMPIHLVNRSNSPISVDRWGEFYLSVPTSPMTDLQVDAGRLAIQPNAGSDAKYITLGAKSSTEVFVVFVNSARLVPALEAGDQSARFVFYQEDGQILTQGGVRFTRENIGEKYLLLELKEPRGSDAAETEGAYNPSLEPSAQAPPLSS